MKSTNWKNIAELIGVAAIVASLLFVGLQLRQDRNLASAQIVVNSDAVRSEYLSLVTENPDVWMSGLQGEDLSKTDSMIFRAIATAHYARHVGMFFQGSLLGVGVEGRDSIAQQYAFDLYQYPPLRQIFLRESSLVDSRNRYFGYEPTITFRVKVAEYLSELDNNPPSFWDENEFPY